MLMVTIKGGVAEFATLGRWEEMTPLVKGRVVPWVHSLSLRQPEAEVIRFQCPDYRFERIGSDGKQGDDALPSRNAILASIDTYRSDPFERRKHPFPPASRQLPEQARFGWAAHGNDIRLEHAWTTGRGRLVRFRSSASSPDSLRRRWSDPYRGSGPDSRGGRPPDAIHSQTGYRLAAFPARLPDEAHSIPTDRPRGMRTQP